MNYSRLISLTALAVALLLNAGCESIDIPPVSRDDSPGQHGPGFQSSGNSTIDAYDLIVYDRIERRWNDLLDALSSLSRDYSSGKVKVTLRIHPNGSITDIKIVERTVGYRQTAACAEAMKNARNIPPWPAEVRKLIRRDYQDLTLTFYYKLHHR
jgi:TonB family protein